MCFIRSRAQPLGVWQALIKLPNGRRISKSFSILKYGREQAFRLANAARANMLTLIDEKPYLKDDTAKSLAENRSGRRPGSASA